jgi:hypothetical protein
MLQMRPSDNSRGRYEWMNESSKLFHRLFGAFLISVFSSASICADEEIESEAVTYQHAGEKYPPVLLVTNIDKPSMVQIFESHKAFSRVDKEAVGLPIGVRVLKLHRTKNDGTQFSSLMLAASTLGIVPVISNKEFKVRYDVFVQGDIVSTFTYQVESTDVSNFWSGPRNDHETKPEEQLFIEESVSRFLVELKESVDTQEVFQEYRDYYGKDS